MVTGLEFLRIACAPVQPRPYKFDPFGLVEQFSGYHNQQYRAKYAGLAATPLFVRASVKLHHPRPVRRFAHMDALARFEQIAQDMDCDEHVADIATFPIAIPRRPNPDALRPDEESKLQMNDRVIGRPVRRSDGYPALRASGGIACANPCLTGYFPKYTKHRSAWGHGPRPEGPPRPTFALIRGTMQRIAPDANAVPATLEEYTKEHGDKGCNNEKQKCDWEELGDDSLSYVSVDFAVEHMENDNGHEDSDVFDEQFYDAEEDEDEDEGYFTASEHADNDYFSDDEAPTQAWSACASPEKLEYPSPTSSFESPSSARFASPTNSIMTANSEACNTQEDFSAAFESHPGLQLLWEAGMSVDSAKFIAAVKQALQHASRGII